MRKKRRAIYLLVAVVGNFPPTPRGLSELEFLEHSLKSFTKNRESIPDSSSFVERDIVELPGLACVFESGAEFLGTEQY